ncbi:hypothetical protein ACFFWC_30640 [Plantactinospora siamensis]|uniref:DUF1579 domain-containing protein n=1 Tax=Plantactinospora siamensis TaxID=555372 RepID=A0ABV6P890_9ACTN
MDNTFDWFTGEWTSRQRRLRSPLTGTDEWYEFPGTHRCWSVLDGRGNVDEARFPSQGWGGLTLRLHDADRDEWSIYWASSRTGLSLPPVVGRFDEAGRGEFTCDDVFAGRAIRVRYLWIDITGTTARWEQAFSTDGEASWETNWVADFTRTG